MNKSELTSEIADKAKNMVDGLLYSNMRAILQDLEAMCKDEDESAVIDVKPTIRLNRTLEGVIDIEAKLEWVYKLKRGDKVDSVRIDPNQPNLF